MPERKENDKAAATNPRKRIPLVESKAPEELTEAIFSIEEFLNDTPKR